MSLIPVFVFIGGVISSVPIVLFTFFVIELVCYIKSRMDSAPKATFRRHLHGMIICLSLLAVIIIAASIIIRYV